MNEAFPPEFLGRIDEILIFKPLTPAIMRAFVLQKDPDAGILDRRKIKATETAVSFCATMVLAPSLGRVN